MAGSINKVILIGNVGKQPEIRAMQNGKEVANLTLATSESWKDKSTGERKEKTEWHKIVVMNDNLVRLAKEYIAKGSKLYVEGTLQTRKWQNKDGADQYSTEIVLHQYGGTIVLLSGKEQASDDRTPPASNHADLDDEIPF